MLFKILGVVLLLLKICDSNPPTIITKFNEVETTSEIFIYPTLDPDIADDSKLTTVNHKFIFKIQIKKNIVIDILVEFFRHN